MDYLTFIRILFAVAVIAAFLFVGRGLKRKSLPAVLLVTAGFALLTLHLVFLPDSSGIFSNADSAFLFVITYISPLVGLAMILMGFYRIHRITIETEERRRIEEEHEVKSSILANSEKRYRQFFEDDLSGNFIFSADGRILACNPALARIFGYESVPEVMNAEGLHLFENQRSFESFVELLRKHRRLGNYQMIMRRKDGSPVYVVANINGEYDADGELLQIQGFVLDETERVKVEQTLRTSVEQFRQVFEEGPVGMMLVSLDGEIIKVNKAFCSMVGYTETELRRITIDGVTHPEDIGKDIERLQLAASGEIKSYRTEKRFVTRNGDLIWGLLTASVVKEVDGTPLYGVRIVEDITARKRGEEELEQSLSVLRATLESTTDGVLVVDLRSRVLNFNQKFAEMWRLPPEILLKRDENDLVSFMFDQLDDQKGFLTTIRSVYNQPESESFDILRFRDGRIIERYSIPQKIGGKTVGRVWSYRDTTQRVRSEEERRVSEEKYRALFEESQDAVFISTPDGRFLDVNPAGVALFGYSSKEELLAVDIGQDIYIDAEERRKAHRLLEEQGFLKDHLTMAKTKDGRKLVILETTTVVKDEMGRVIASRGILRDVTEQRRLEEQLRQVQRMESVGTLAGGIAHDFNNILSIAVGYLARLERPNIHQDAHAHTIASIRKALERGSGLVQQLLTFARKTSGVPEAVHVNEIVQELSTLLLETFPPGIHFDLQLDDRVPLLLADPGQLQQAVLNLCINARDAMTPEESGGVANGTLKITTSTISRESLARKYPAAKAGEYVLISVADTGIGMDEATKLRIFEPFFTTKPPGKGTGLGLSVVYGVVDGHKGVIDVESSPGKGAVISLYFPVEPVEEPAMPDTVVEETVRGEGETVLLVEDEEMLLDLLQALLEENGYRVLTARDGMEAVEVYKTNVRDISIVLSDMGLPRLGGWEAFRRMREVNPGIRCILASGYFDPNLRLEMIREGALDFIQKPYVPNMILARINEAIHRPPNDNPAS